MKSRLVSLTDFLELKLVNNWAEVIGTVIVRIIGTSSFMF